MLTGGAWTNSSSLSPDFASSKQSGYLIDFGI
jgi:hypothetical protein